MNQNRNMSFRILAIALGVLGIALSFTGCASTGGRSSSGPPVGVPSLVEVKRPVDEAEAKAAKAFLQDPSVTVGNLKAFMTAAQWEFNTGRMKEAAVLFQRVAAEGPKGASALRAQYMAGESYFGDRQMLAALSAFQKVLEKSPSSDYGRQAKQMMEFLLKYSLDADVLIQFTTNYPNSAFRCEALFQYARRKADMGNRSEAAQGLKDFLEICPNHPAVQDARMLAASLEQRSTGKPRKIGVLMPLTGSYASLGKSVVDGVQLAVDQANASGGQVEVVVLDTLGSPQEAKKSARTLVTENQVDAILGPLRPNEATDVASVANDARVPMLYPAATSENQESVGPYIFSNGMTNELQARVMAKYAVGRLGIKSFGIVSPQTSYGIALSRTFRTEVEALGGTVTATSDYPQGTTDFRDALTRLGGRNPTIDKENDRENQRREQQMVYAMKKEFLKAVMPLSAVAGGASTLAVAWAPFVESFTNTSCPSVAHIVGQAAAEAWTGLKNPVRPRELVEQALTRLPEEALENTEVNSNEDWKPVIEDLKVNLLISGVIIETDPPEAGADNDTWDYKIRLDVRTVPPDRPETLKSSAVTLSYRIFKKSEFLSTASSFEALYLPVKAEDVPLLASQLRFYNLKPQLLGGHLWDNDRVIRDGAASVDRAVFVTGFWADSPKPAVKEFVSAFGSKYGRKPDLYAAQAYDGARMLIEAFDGSSGREDVKNKLAGKRNFEGVSGRISFEGSRAEKDLSILQIEKGKLKQIQ